MDHVSIFAECDSTGLIIGEVEGVLGKDNETPTAVSVDLNDDVAENDRVVPLDNLSMSGNQLVINVVNEAMPNCRSTTTERALQGPDHHTRPLQHLEPFIRFPVEQGI